MLVWYALWRRQTTLERDEGRREDRTPSRGGFSESKKIPVRQVFSCLSERA
jgi:hypothetical protein